MSEHEGGLSAENDAPRSLAQLARDGYCIDEWDRWQQGMCGTYALALIRAYPHLRFGTMGETENGKGDATDGWSVTHHFAHDDHYAYDSAGRHPLPYRGVHETSDYAELDGDPKDWSPLDEEGADEADILAAQDHARRHGIMTLPPSVHSAR